MSIARISPSTMIPFQITLTGERALCETAAGVLDAAAPEELTALSWYESREGWVVDAFLLAETAHDAEARVRTALARGMEGALPTLSVAALDPGIDWVAKSLSGLTPVIAGRFVVHGAHDRTNVPKGLIPIEIEANRAFGTGHHPTTAGVLRLLSPLLRRHRFSRMLDLGTGSGVLAIALAKATRQGVLASDNDAISVMIARENAWLNRVGSRVHVVEAAGFAHPLLARGAFDLIVANILAGPLKTLAPDFRRATRPGASILLSGILAGQAAGVLAAFRSHGFVRDTLSIAEGWATLSLRRSA